MRFQDRPRRRWRVYQELGGMNGGMNGGIASVIDCDNGKRFIEKRSLAETIQHGETQNEIAALRQLGGHPNIVTMVDHFIDFRRGRGSIYLEMCHYGSMHKLIESKNNQTGAPISERQIWEWLVQLADALAYCHSGPEPHDKQKRDRWDFIWHRDIKPANILIQAFKKGTPDEKRVAVLADFGCSITRARLSTKRHRIEFMCTAQDPHFAPPESPAYQDRSDIFQLGIVMICLCNLSFEWRSVDWQHPAPMYSRKLNGVISRCMRLDHDERPSALRLHRYVKSTYESIKDSLPINGTGGKKHPGWPRDPFK